MILSIFMLGINADATNPPAGTTATGTSGDPNKPPAGTTATGTSGAQTTATTAGANAGSTTGTNAATATGASTPATHSDHCQQTTAASECTPNKGCLFVNNACRKMTVDEQILKEWVRAAEGSGGSIISSELQIDKFIEFLSRDDPFNADRMRQYVE
jgi:hypothetical protein